MKRLTVADIEEEASNVPVWALNGTAEVRVAGDLIITIPKLNGSKVDALKLPATWLPTCVTEQIPKMQLLASSEFRQAVTRGSIILISAEDAKALNNEYGAQEERDRLGEQERRVTEAMQGQAVHSNNPNLVNEEDTMDPAFVIFFDSLKEKSDAEAYNAMRTRSKFTSKELQYLARNLVDKPNCLKHVEGLLRG